jgi:hypothetical protein
MSTLPQKLFLNVYAPFAAQIGTAYATREHADQMAARGRLACVEVDLRDIDKYVGALEICVSGVCNLMTTAK